MTHAELVARAERWLRRTIRCGVVLTEARGSGAELPDAIGWRGGYCPESYLVECKVSRSDFLADRKKVFRLYGDIGVGRFRYYLTPPGLIRPDELPPRWGLLEVQERRVRVVRKARRWRPEVAGMVVGINHEIGILLSHLRLIQIVQQGGTINLGTQSGRRVGDLLGIAKGQRKGGAS